MAKMTSIQADLDKLVKRAAAIKADALKPKTASIGDDAKDGTKPAATGEQAAANAAASKDRVEAAMVDGSAKDNAAGKSLEAHNSDGVAAAATDGKEGAKGAVLDVAKTEPLTTDDVMKTASSLVAELRKAAAAANQANASVENHNSEGVTAVATDGKSGGKGAENAVAAKEGTKGGAEAEKAIAAEEGACKTAAAVLAKKDEKKEEKKPQAKVAGIRGFLAQAALSIPQVKTAADAEGMGEEQVGDAAAEDLLQKLESGQVTEEEAQQILQEAIASGAISEEDVTAAIAEAQGGQAAGPEGAAPAEAGAPAPGPEGAPVAPEQMVAEQAKLASVGPEHPEYMNKLAYLYGSIAEAGHQFALKLAAELEEKVEEKTEKAEDKAIDALQTAQSAEKAVEGGNLEAKTEEEKLALAQAQKELGLSDADLAALAQAPAPKLASLTDKYRAAILVKAASFHKAN